MIQTQTFSIHQCIFYTQTTNNSQKIQGTIPTTMNTKQKIYKPRTPTNTMKYKKYNVSPRSIIHNGNVPGKN